MKRYSKLTLSEEVVEEMDELVKESAVISNRNDLLSTLLYKIRKGDYDETFKNEIANQRLINIESNESKETRKYVKERGVKNLREAIDILLIAENEKEEKTDFDEEFVKMKKERSDLNE